MEVCTVYGDAGHPTLTGPLKITCAVLRPEDTVEVDTATVVPLSKKVWAASAEWCRVWRVTTVARLPGHNHRHHRRTTLNKEGRRGPLKARSDSNSAWKDLRSVDGFLHPTLRHRHYRHHTAALLEFEPFYSAGDGDTFWKVDTLTFTFTASFHWDEIFDSKKGF